MNDRRESVRNFFPVEATAAYVALIGIFTANDIGPSELDIPMLWVIAGLAVVNAWVYFKFRALTDWRLHVVLAVGFLLWAFNTDIPRFRDLAVIGPYIEIVAPIGLIFYVLVTSFVQLPKPADGGH